MPAEVGKLQIGFTGTLNKISLRLAQSSNKGLRSLQTFSHDLFGGSSVSVFLDELPRIIGCLCLYHHDRNVFTAIGLGHDATGHSHIEYGVFQLRVFGEAHPLPINKGHTHTTDRPAKGRTR